MIYCTTEHCSCMGIKQFSAGKAIRCTAESCKNKSEPSCGSCKWYAEPEGVCVNDQSEHVADFVWDERGCKNGRRKMSESNVIRLGNGILLDSKGKLLCQTVDKSCSNCKWHDRFSWVCYNGLSERRANFTDPEDVCKEWEKRENEL